MTSTSDKVAIVDDMETGENSPPEPQQPPAYSENPIQPVTMTIPVVTWTKVTFVETVERQQQEEEKHSKCLVIYTWVLQFFVA